MGVFVFIRLDVGEYHDDVVGFCKSQVALQSDVLNEIDTLHQKPQAADKNCDYLLRCIHALDEVWLNTERQTPSRAKFSRRSSNEVSQPWKAK